MHHYCWKFQRLPKRKWPKPWSSMEDPVVPLERNLYGHPLAGLLWRRQSEKVLLEHGWEKFQIGNAYSLTETKGLFFSVYVDGYKTGWKETEHWPNVENTHERRWFWRTDIIPWPCLFGLHSKSMSDKRRYCRQLQEYVRIQDLCWSCGKTTRNQSFRETWYEHYFFMVLWYGKVMQRSAWKDIANWRTKQLNCYT